MKIQKSRVFFSFPGKIYVFEVISPLDNFSREKRSSGARPAPGKRPAAPLQKERTAGLLSGFAIRLSPPAAGRGSEIAALLPKEPTPTT